MSRKQIKTAAVLAALRLRIGAVIRAGGVDAEDGFARFHHVQLIASQQLRVSWVILEKSQFLALLIE
jgi:hypothetical protein